ncbi:MAG: hypothetical protein HFH87_16380, partial [Lachnospiraceae bacterium]|nr:hypothetical protein [Lachnospiraceae bacterium]
SGVDSAALLSQHCTTHLSFEPSGAFLPSYKKKIQLPENLKSFGSYEVIAKLHPQVAAKLTVKVVES